MAKPAEKKATENLNIPCTPALRKQVMEYAEQRSLSISDVCRMAIMEFLPKGRG